MKANLFSLLLAAVMIIGTVTTVSADDGWYVNFTGTNPLESNFTSLDMSEKAATMQPGDDITYEITVMNTKDRDTTVNYYLKNDIVYSFEASEKQPTGAVYEYELYYVDSNGNTKYFYNNKAVGGDESQGLEDVGDELGSYFLIDQLDYNENGKLYLKIALDGETQRNDYQDTMAELALQFQVEEVESKADDIVIIETKKGDTKTVYYNNQGVKTGDAAKLLPYLIVLGISGIAILAFVIILFQKKRKEE